MKSLLLSIVLNFMVCGGLNAQDKLVNPLSKKLILVELEEDFSAFQRKVTQLNLKKANKALLAEEYSDLIDRMDTMFHTTQPNSKVYISAAKLDTKKSH
mgnify:CR=1 FL=1